MVRAAVRIQKTMTVTKPTARIEALPPMSSWVSKLSWRVPKVRTAPRTTDSTIAVATPAHTHFVAQVRPVLARKATRMTTTSAASRPSRRPMRALLTSMVVSLDVLRTTYQLRSSLVSTRGGSPVK